MSPTRCRPIPARGAETGRTSQFLGCERELRLGVYFLFRLFNVAPETTARFSHLDDQSRSLSPPGYGLPIGHGGRSVVILPVVAGTGPGQRCDPPLVAARASRAASREASRLAMARRLSYWRRPRARASSTLALPSLK